MNYDIIQTGSRGNAILLQCGVLLDCGVSWKQLAPVVPQIRLVLLTHIHKDHFNPSTIKRLAVNRPSVRFGCCGWLAGDLSRCAEKKRIDVYKENSFFRYGGGLVIRPLTLTHDVPNCGYQVMFGGEKAFYATDTYQIPWQVSADLYLIEGNHHEDEIQQRIREKQERGEFAYEVRAAKTHQSIERAERWLLQNAPPGAEYELIHQHQD